MNETWTCNRCGGTSNHFNSSRGCLVCDTCGVEVRTEAERNADLDFQRNMALAKQHLKVGNWEDAKRIVKPYVNIKPAEKQVYLYLLVATTKCFEDYLIDDPIAAKEAAEYWDKLKRLGCVNSAMINYSQRRMVTIRGLQNEVNAKRLVVVGINVIVTLITLGMLLNGAEMSVLMVIFTIVGWVYCSKWLKRNKAENFE